MVGKLFGVRVLMREKNERVWEFRMVREKIERIVLILKWGKSA